MGSELTFPNFSLEGKGALVTGAGRGIGRALALGLAHAGADVVLAARTLDDLESVAAEVRALGRTAGVVAMDARSVDSVRLAVVKAAETLNGLDILINNAGIELTSDSLETTEEIWDTVVDTNLKGAFFCAQAAAKIMAYSDGGAIINLGSITSGVGIPTAVPYGSSKTGIIGMTRALAAEWAHLRIRVNAICPGYYRTAMTDAFFENEKWHKTTLSKIPMRRFGELSDLIGAAVFLSADASSYVTGTELYVDGGFMASV